MSLCLGRKHWTRPRGAGRLRGPPILGTSEVLRVARGWRVLCGQEAKSSSVVRLLLHEPGQRTLGHRVFDWKILSLGDASVGGMR